MPRRRRLLAAAMLALLTLSAGCSSVLGPAPVKDSELIGETEYAWDASAADGYIDVDRNEYTAIYRVANRTTGVRESGERPTIELYGRDALGTDEPLKVRDVVFRYPNGTSLEFREGDGEARLVRVSPDGSVEPAEDDALTVTRTRKRTVVGLPANDTGRLAFTAPKNGKGVSTPTFVRGDYEMVLPDRARVGVPLLAQVRPGGSRTTVDDDGRVHVHWSDVRAPAINVRYYLQRDLLLFGALAAGMAITGLIGAGYYLLQIRETVRKREEVGLDVEVPDDDSDGPPPGMR